MAKDQEPEVLADNTDTLRVLSAEECAQVAGGWGDSCYYSYTSGNSVSYTSNNSDAKN